MGSYSKSISAVVIAVIALVIAVWTFDPAEDSWSSIAEPVGDIASAAGSAKVEAISSGDYGACLAAEVTKSVAFAAADSLVSADEGVCTFPAVDLFLGDCLEIKGEVPVKDVPAIVEAGIGPVLAVATLAADKAPDSKVKPWGIGALNWISGGKESILAAIESPTESAVVLSAVKVEGCHVPAVGTK